VTLKLESFKEERRRRRRRSLQHHCEGGNEIVSEAEVSLSLAVGLANLLRNVALVRFSSSQHPFRVSVFTVSSPCQHVNH